MVALRLFLLALFLTQSTHAQSIEEAAAVVDIADKAIDAGGKALDLFNKMINQAIPWKQFKESMDALEANQKQYSDEAGKQVGEIQTLLLDSYDVYNSAVQSVYKWCKFAVPLLSNYMHLFSYTNDTKIAETQKMLLLNVLDKGNEEMTNAIKHLSDSRHSFNAASGKLTTLKTTLDNDFKRGSAYFEAAVSEVRTKAYSGAAAGAVLGPIGLAISYSIAAGVVEGDLVPTLKKAFAETQVMFEHLEDIVQDAQSKIGEAKTALNEEIRVQGVMSAKIEETETFAATWAIVPDVMFTSLMASAEQLIDMCNDYIKNADNNAKIGTTNSLLGSQQPQGTLWFGFSSFVKAKVQSTRDYLTNTANRLFYCSCLELRLGQCT